MPRTTQPPRCPVDQPRSIALRGWELHPGWNPRALRLSSSHPGRGDGYGRTAHAVQPGWSNSRPCMRLSIPGLWARSSVRTASVAAGPDICHHPPERWPGTRLVTPIGPRAPGLLCTEALPAVPARRKADLGLSQVGFSLESSSTVPSQHHPCRVTTRFITRPAPADRAALPAAADPPRCLPEVALRLANYWPPTRSAACRRGW